MTQTIEIADEAGTVALGERLAASLGPPATVALVGPLGAGKTRLVQAIAAALGADEEVTSPTFVLVNEYRTGRVPVYHFDAYRLEDEDELFELGAEEYFAGLVASGPGLTLVEWGDRFPDSLPSDTVTVRIDVIGETRRRVTIEGMPDGVRLG